LRRFFAVLTFLRDKSRAPFTDRSADFSPQESQAPVSLRLLPCVNPCG